MKNKFFRNISTLFIASFVLSVAPGAIPAYAAETTLPSSYDARDYGYVTDEKIQYGGSCWAFAATAAAESSLIKSGLADRSIDLSELHTAYYTYNTFIDPIGNTVGDEGRINSIYGVLNEGGKAEDAAELYAKWCGPVAESSMPYSKDEYLNRIYPEITKDLSAESLFHLKKVVYQDYNDRDGVKRMILQYGSVVGSYYSGNGYNYEHEEVTYHVPNATTPNHDVSIIGWDDTYPKENFTRQPQNDGAWLVKNHCGRNSWLWISYETCVSGITAFEFEPAGLLENNYQYDGFSGHGNTTYNAVTSSSRPEVKSYMNVFQAKKSTKTLEKLEAVMIHGANGGVVHRVQIYINPVMKDGQLVDYEYKSEPFEYTFDKNGIYKVDLPEDIYLNDGDTFGIELSGDGISEFQIAASYPSTGKDVANPGESYVGKTEYGEFSYVDLSGVQGAGSLRIKGFTNSTNIPLAGDVTISTTGESMKPGEAFRIDASVSVPNGAKSGISFTSSDPSVASVDEAGNVTAVSPGEATITVRAMYGSGLKECKVEVQEIPMNTLTVEESVELDMTAEYRLNPVTNEDATNKCFTYESASPWIADVDENGRIYAAYPGTTTITVRTADGSNLSAVCMVTVKSPWVDSLVPCGGTVPPATIPTTPQIQQTGGTSAGTTTGNTNAASQTSQTRTGIPIGTLFVSGYLKYSVVSETAVTVIDIRNSSITSVSVPATVRYRKNVFKVTGIGKKTFSRCKKLKSVTIGANVKTIGEKAFCNCKKLKSIKFTGKAVKSVGKNAFKNVPKNAKVIVPKAKYKAYKKLFKKAGISAKAVWKKQ